LRSESVARRGNLGEKKRRQMKEKNAFLGQIKRLSRNRFGQRGGGKGGSSCKEKEEKRRRKKKKCLESPSLVVISRTQQAVGLAEGAFDKKKGEISPDLR